jgi:hypothetical protein
MLATILPEKPIWDRYVVQNLNLKLTGATKKEKLVNAVILYADMEKWYVDFLDRKKEKNVFWNLTGCYPIIKEYQILKR